MFPWRIARSVVRGTSHEASGTPCQDYALHDAICDAGGFPRCILVAVADGAGSARMSAEGSKRACEEAVRSLKASEGLLEGAGSAQEAVRVAFLAAIAGVDELAGEHELPSREFASTLLVAVLAPWGGAFGQIGDGAIVVLGDGAFSLVFVVDQEMVNVTDMITSRDAIDRLHLQAIEARIDGFAVTTDGMTGLLINSKTRQPHKPAFEMLFSTMRHSPLPDDLNDDLAKLLGSESVNQRTDDDKSMVLGYRESPSVDVGQNQPCLP